MLPTILASYEVASAAPMVTSTGMRWLPWVEVAVAPYKVTRVPCGQRTGLTPAPPAGPLAGLPAA